MSRRYRSRAALTTLFLVATAAFTACSSDDADSGSDAGDGLNTEKRTIGFVEITEAAPVVIETVNEFKKGAEMLGWEVKVVNANGDPAQMAAGVSAMVNQNVDAIVTMAIPPSAAAQGLNQAKAKGIPAIEIGAPVTDPEGLYAATYAPDDKKMATMVAEQMVKDLGGTGKLLELKASAQDAIALRAEALREVIEGTDIEIVAEHETDLSNPIQDTQSAVSNALRANPEINAVWAPQDFEFVPAVTTITTQKLNGAGVYSTYLNTPSFELLRKNEVPMAIADSPLRFVSWYALDALVNKFILEKDDWITDASVYELPYVLVTPENVPDEDAWPYEEFAPFFADRWTEAGIDLKS